MYSNEDQLFSFLIAIAGSACSHQSETNGAEEETAAYTLVSVKEVTDTVEIKDEISLNATATYLLRSDAKANATGYITMVSIKAGDRVGKGNTIFLLQTKEARALGNTINQLDKSFRFNGTTSVQSPSTGFVTMINHQVGDYVQDGEILATITDASSFGFLLNVPYEYMQLLQKTG